jgi:hypothetical protein
VADTMPFRNLRRQGGFFMAKLLGSVRKKMLTVGLPAVLDDLECGRGDSNPHGVSTNRT